jgi:hypothetical protein
MVLVLLRSTTVDRGPRLRGKHTCGDVSSRIHSLWESSDVARQLGSCTRKVQELFNCRVGEGPASWA